MIENIQRQDLSAFEETAAFKKLLDTKITQKELSRQVGKSRTYIVHYRNSPIKFPIAFHEGCGYFSIKLTVMIGVRTLIKSTKVIKKPKGLTIVNRY